MSNYTRKNAWDANNGGQFKDQDGNFTDLYWYAKGVGDMMAKSLSDPTSWWFYAAIHGQYIVDNDGSGAPPTGFPNWADIPPVPHVPITPLPSDDVIKQYWDQCQHGGWFFPPWHRGYIYAIENILREVIERLGGPTDWALPYWNYLKSNTNQYQMPPAFASKTLPDGTSNPLYVNARYGPNGDENIFVQIPPASQQCQQAKIYADGYGGGETGFSHFSGKTGDLEQNPHNLVHVMVGGRGGLMSDPGLAALDPIFYLHHCNIDRMWAAWNAAGRKNPTDANWLNGPTASGQRKFYMPKPDQSSWEYTPEMVNEISQLDYTYDDLSIGLSPLVVNRNMKRLRNLGQNPDNTKSVSDMESKATPELVGANTSQFDLSSSGAHTSVKLDSSSWKTVTTSLRKASVSNLPDKVYLQLEGVKGDADDNLYTLTVNQQYVGHISLFGLRKASMKNGHHAGSGLTIRFDISEIIDDLHINDAMEDTLDVLIQPAGSVSDTANCVIERVSVYKVKNQ